MSRSSHQRQQQKLQQQQQLLAQQQQMAENEAAAAAAEMFDLFCVATTMRQVLGLHRNMCDCVGLRPAPLNEFYPKLKAKIRSWKAQALWKKFDARAAHRAYAKGNACTGTRVLVIGAGPCGLRTAIEAQLLGAKVVVVEKRDRISRNNVLHLWPFVITDLRNLGAKKFYGKFCAGSIDHISIRQLQCILLKVALLLGVEIHEGVSFDGTIEPNGDGCGWRAAVTPADHVVSHYEFDVLIGADGKRNTLEGFKRKEFRGKLAIAITANFINKKTEAEAKAEEISGVAFIFNQSFFKELYHTTGIDLENIVYYKDETHYFVMTAKKHSLIDKGVIMQDFADPAELLASANVNTEKLLDYAREAAEFSTKYQMPNLEFAVNHYGKPDVAMFDFTSMFAAETSCRVIVRKGFRLMQCLVGDSLLEPFWPTGSGCARGFLSSMDAAYAIKLWSNPRNSTLAVLAQRESIYRLLNQTTPENLQRDIGSYTVDPATRYPNLNRTSVNVWQVKHLIDTDDNSILEQTFMDTNALQATQVDTPVRRKRRSGDSMPLSTVLLRWICAQLHSYEFTKSLKEVSDVFTNGKVLCALINRYRPDLVDYNAIQDLSAIECNEIAFKILDKELNIPRIMSGKDSVNLNSVESKVWLNYLEQICEVFRGEIPHVKHPKMDFSELREKYRFNANAQPDFSKLLQLSSKQKSKSPMQDMVDVPQVVQRRSVLDEDKLKRQRKHTADSNMGTATSGQTGQLETPRRAKKRRSAEKAANIEERQNRLLEIEQNRQDRQSRRRQQRYQQTQNFYKSLHMLQANTLLRESDEATAFEDYSIYLYRQQAPEFNDRVKELERKLLYPDRERSDIPSALPRNVIDEQFSDRIKSMEQRITSRNTYGTEKKPKDLMRAIGKIDSNDWNVREIEKKIEQSKKTEIHGPKGREKVPKWSKEQFMARHNKMSKPMRQDSGEEKFKEIDQTLKNLDKQLKEGSVLEVGERGRNKVASIAGQFVKKDDTSDEKNPPTVVQKSSSKVALAFKKQAASEKCHFCKQTVYLMEKINTEGLILHRSCLKCHHCHTNLRLGGYAFDRDDPNGRFYCTQHFRLPAKAIRPVVRKPGQRKPTQQQQAAAAAIAAAVANDDTNDGNVDAEPKTPDKLRGHADSVAQLDLLDRGQTPERIEFENTDAMSDGEPSEEHIIDENEWSGRNFLPESNNDSESDLSSSEESDSESDSDMFEEANDSPLGVQTLQLATDWIGKQNYSESDDSDDFYDSSDGLADDGKDDTEGEEFKKARELRREEVRLLPLPANLPTDTETEIKFLNENKENIEIKTSQTEEDQHPKEHPVKPDLDKFSEKSFNSDKSFVSAASSATATETGIPQQSFTVTKADIEKLDQNSDRKFSSEIDEISEKLYRLNNMMKMNKDLESLAKENLVKTDILKKLTLKEKWLANNNVGNMNPIAPKSEFDIKLEKLRKSGEREEAKETNGVYNLGKESTDSKLVLSGTEPEQSVNLSRNNSLQKSNQLSPKVERKGSAASSRSNSFKCNASANSKGTPKSSNISRTNSIKKNIPVLSENKMQIENVLNIVKKIDLTGGESPSDTDNDAGKMLYDAETRFSPKPNRNMTAKLKEIEAKSFAGTMDTIKSQMVMPTVSTQAAATVDLSKYFPNQKQEKAASLALNKNQKNLKDVDLTKYFPSSPVPQKRSTVTTVAERLKKSQTDASLATAATLSGKKSGAAPSAAATKTTTAPKRQTSVGSTTFSLRDHQLDGAVDITKKKPTVVTTTASASTTKKGNVKIIKKMVPKGSKAKKTNSNTNASKKSILPPDESDLIIDEILCTDNHDDRSPSLEYKKLFEEEKSPSDDISDKIERILEETGIDLGIPRKPSIDKRKKLQKTKSLGEGEFERDQAKLKSNESFSTKEDGDHPTSGVQSILRRFESMSSVKSEDQAFKLQRMESSTSNLNKSRESIVSRESESFSDLEKTMEYLKTEWRNEASNFLRKKRDNFYAEKRSAEEDAAAAQKEEQKKSRYDDLPVQYRESKLAKFFGIKSKSPEKKKLKSPTKKKSPEKKVIPVMKKVTPISRILEPVKTKSHQKDVNKNIVPKASDIIAMLEEKSNSRESSRRTSLDSLKSVSEIVKPINSPSNVINISSENEFTPLKEKSIKEDTNLELKPNTTAELFNKVSQTLLEHNSTDSAKNSNNTGYITPTENRRPLVEDIKNLPKFGCDKSQSNSRRGSQSSLQSRRQSDASLTEKLENVANELSKNSPTKVEPKIGEIFNHMVTELDKPTETIEAKICKDTKTVNHNELKEDVCSSNSGSKSSSVAPITVQQRGSSEDESIEKLFGEFTDNMLVDVEFDSNDELIAITPRTVLLQNYEDSEADKDHLDKVESLEMDPEVVLANTNTLQSSITDPRKEEIKQTSNFEMSKLPSNKSSLHDVDDEKTSDPHFPIRPQRRQKSSSSSSEPSVPIAPQRMKKKLAKLNPSNMSPSVQDFIRGMFSMNFESSQNVPLIKNTPLKFPYNMEEIEHPCDPVSCSNIVKEENNVKSTNDLDIGLVSISKIIEKSYAAKNDTTSLTLEVPPFPNCSSQDVKLNKNKSSSTITSINPTADIGLVPISKIIEKATDAKNNTNTIPVDVTILPNGHPVDNNLNTNISTNPERKLSISSTKSKESSSPNSKEYILPIRKSSITSPNTSLNNISQPQDIKTPIKANLAQLKERPSPMSSKNSSIASGNISMHNSDTDTDNGIPLTKIIPPKAVSKELMEWDMEKMPSSPMPPRKFVHADRGPYNELPILEVSPTRSIKILNNLPKINADEEKSRIIVDMEQERRKNLLQREKEYAERHLPVDITDVKRRNSDQGSVSKKSTPIVTPQNPSPAESLKIDQQSICSNRSGTPPNFKKLEIPSDFKTTPQTSRRSSATFSDLPITSGPISAPMPKKLQIPKVVPSIVESDNDDEPIAEIFHNRPWPKLENDKRSESVEKDDMEAFIKKQREKRSSPKPESPIEEVFKNRAWPKSNPNMGEGYTPEPFGRENIDRSCDQRSGYRLESPSPPLRHNNTRDTGRPTSLATQLHNSSQSIYGPTQRSSQSSVDTDSNSYMTSRSVDQFPSVPHRHIRSIPTHDAVDTGTRLLLDRGKSLHDRKRDFMNERVAERNPYMKRMINEESIERNILGDPEVELESYRPKNFTTPRRFPTSHALGRGSAASSIHYDYGSPSSVYNDYGSSGRRLYTSTIPSSSHRYQYPIPTSTAYSSTGTSGRSHLTDYLPRSTPQYKDRELSKESSHYYPYLY